MAGLCHFFSSSWCRGLAAVSACGSSWTFLFTFLHTSVILVNLISIKLEKMLKKYVIFLIYNKDSKKKRKCFSSSIKFITNIKNINAVVHELFSVLAD